MGDAVDLAKIRKKAQRDPQSQAQPPPQDNFPKEEARDPIPEETIPEAPATDPPPEPAPVHDAETGSEWEAVRAARRSPAPAEASPVPEGVEGLAGSGVPLSETTANRERVLLFSVGREHYAMPIQDISLIIENRPATPVPNVPPFVVGIISLRGRIVTILDARARLALGEGGIPEGAKVVVLDRGADQFGILVDNIVHVLEVDRSAMEPPPEGFLLGEREFVDGVFYYKGTAVAALDLERFLDFQV